MENKLTWLGIFLAFIPLLIPDNLFPEGYGNVAWLTRISTILIGGLIIIFQKKRLILYPSLVIVLFTYFPLYFFLKPDLSAEGQLLCKISFKDTLSLHVSRFAPEENWAHYNLQNEIIEGIDQGLFGNQLVTNTIPKFYDNFNQAGFYDFELRQLIESCEITHGILVYGSSSGSDKDALINCKIFIHNLMKLNQIEEIRPEYPLKIPDSLSLHAKAKYVSEFINGLFAFHLGHDIKRISAFFDYVIQQGSGNNDLISKCYLYKGLANAKIGEFNTAIESMQKAIEINPLEDLAGVNLGITYLKQGQWEKGRATLIARNNLDPSILKLLTDIEINLKAAITVKDTTNVVKPDPFNELQPEIRKTKAKAVKEPPPQLMDSAIKDSISIHQILRSRENDFPIEQELVPDSLKTISELKYEYHNRTVYLHKVKFSKGQSELKRKKYQELDDIFFLMETDPSLYIKIQASSAIKSIGEPHLKRVKAIKRYLVEVGIKENRIQAQILTLMDVNHKKRNDWIRVEIYHLK